MTDFRSFKGAAKRLEDIDLPRIGSEIGVGEDELHAFMDVEAAGSGFDSQGRPKILFEPHVFYRNLDGKKRDAAVKAGLAYSKWGEKPYPKDSYPRLLKALAIDEVAALKATSWGLTQILGENCVGAGYATPQVMVLAFMEDEENHLEATVSLLKHMSIADDLKAHNWAVVARVWNGPGYRKNKYDTKMAAAFAKWQKIKDTPSEGRAKHMPALAIPAAKTDTTTVEIVQRKLFEKGYTEVGSRRADGSFDGELGKMTRGAITVFRQENDLPAGDFIDQQLLDALDKASARKLARNDAPAQLVRQAVPEVRSNWMIKIGAIVTTAISGAGTFFDGIVANLGIARGYVDNVKDYAADVPGYVWMGAVVAVAGGVYLVARHGEKKGVEAFQSGERR